MAALMPVMLEAQFTHYSALFSKFLIAPEVSRILDVLISSLGKPFK
jgi:hypothetical protein